MERLKRLEDICQPDERWLNRVDIDHSTGAVTPTTVESIYTLVEEIELSANVPDDVRSHFEIARNLAVYSWFVYSFSVVAAMQALASLEMTVRIKTNAKKRDSFYDLLDRVFPGRELTSALAPPVPLSKVVTKLRNDLAHGSSTMHGQGVNTLGFCAELINELYT
jgi:hypothetical protein